MYPTFSDVRIVDVSYTGFTGSEDVIIRGHNRLAISFTLTYDYVPHLDQRIQTFTINAGTAEYSFPITFDGNVYGETIVTSFESSSILSTYLEDIKDNRIILTATDWRGQKGSYAVHLNMLNYSDISVYGTTTPISTSGSSTVNFFGSMFYPSFGAVNNTVTASYKCYDQNGSVVKSSSNHPVSIDGEGNFTGQISLTGLNYETNYSIQIKVQDKITSSTITLSTSGDPLFHWDNNDFQFNIPVYIRNGLQLGTNASIYGGSSTLDGKELMSLDGEDLRLGFSSYANESGTTYVYGNDIQFNYNANGGGSVNIQMLNGLINCLISPYSLTATARAVSTVGGYYPERDEGYEYSLHDLSPSCSCTLRGCNLFVRFYCSGLSTWGVGSGDIDDICLGTVKIYHNGMITGAEAVVSNAGSSGVTCGLMMKDLYVDDEILAFQPFICNSTGSMDAVLTTFLIPVTLDLTKF